MGQIDEISRALGSIESSISNLVNDHKETRDLQIVMNDKLNTLAGATTLQQAQIDAAHARLDKIQPMVEGHENKFKFGAWLIAGIAGVVTFLVNVVPSFLGRFF